MEIKLELLREHISEFISAKIEDFSIDADAIANTTAIEMISEIQSVLKNEELSDFDAIEEIVLVFEKHEISC